MNPQATLEQIIDGITLDIFEAERNFAIVTTLADFSDSITTDKRNYSLFFATIQQLAQHAMLLSLARIYDRPSDRYPTISLPAALKILADTSTPLPEIVEKPNLAKTLSAFSAQISDYSFVMNGSDDDIRSLIHTRITDALTLPNAVQARNDLKTVRDKRFAHRESVADLRSPTWKAFSHLVRITQEAITILGWAFTSTVHSIDGEYLMSSDARHPSLCMQRVLTELKFSKG